MTTATDERPTETSGQIPPVVVRRPDGSTMGTMRKLPTHSRENCAKAFAGRLSALFDSLGNGEVFWEFQLDAPPTVGYVLGPSYHRDNEVSLQVEGGSGQQLRQFRLTVECVEASQYEPGE